MHAFLTKGLAETAPLWSDVEQGYAWVHRAAHILSNDNELEAAVVRQTYETLVEEMERTLTPSEPLTMMLSTFRKVTTSYWSGLFHCYDQADLPRTNNELEQYLAQRGIMNDERAGANKRYQGSSFVEPCESLHPLLLASILFPGQICVRLIWPAGAPCAAN